VFTLGMQRARTVVSSAQMKYWIDRDCGDAKCIIRATLMIREYANVKLDRFWVTLKCAAVVLNSAARFPTSAEACRPM